MQYAWSLIAALVLTCGLITPLQAQPPRHPERPGGEHHPSPPATVVARVNVDVETEVDVAKDAPADQAESDEDEEDGEDNEEQGADLGKLVESVLSQRGSGGGVQIIADVNINVETSIKVRSQSARTPNPRQAAAPPAERLKSDEADEKQTTPAPEQPAPKKKRNRKRNRKEEQTSVPAETPESKSGIGLSKLKLGDNLEVGLTKQVESEQRARQIANQINVGKNQSLLGMALVGMMIPEQSESLQVVRKAISSVQADASGTELTVSAAIPKETPLAVTALVKAALNKDSGKQ